MARNGRCPAHFAGRARELGFRRNTKAVSALIKSGDGLSFFPMRRYRRGSLEGGTMPFNRR